MNRTKKQYKIKSRSPTPFEMRAYNVVSRIPKGSTTTYNSIAKILSSSPRAVGQALKRNPYTPKVPCHRVIHSDGRIGGYNGIRNSKKKIMMLKKRWSGDSQRRKTMKIIIVRHGETIENVNRIIQGQHPGHLSKKGISQAKSLASRLKDEDISAIYSSDLKRCRDTTKYIAKYHPDIKPVYDKRIRERGFGKLEGKKVPENWDWNNLSECVESNSAVYDRVRKFLLEIYPKHKKDSVIIVSHGGVKIAFMLLLHNKPLKEFNKISVADNTSVTMAYIKSIYRGRISASIERINCTEHLK